MHKTHVNPLIHRLEASALMFSPSADYLFTYEYSDLVSRLTVVYFPSWPRAGKVSVCALQIFSTIRPSSDVSSYVSMIVIFTASFFPFLRIRSFLTAAERGRRRLQDNQDRTQKNISFIFTYRQVYC